MKAKKQTYIKSFDAERLCQQISKTLAHVGVTQEMVLATLPDARKRIYKRRYRSKKGQTRKSGLHT